MPEIQKVSIRHNEIMDYLMANPAVRLGDVAKHFGISQPWLSTIIHSDAFQTLLKEKQNIAFHHTVLPVREKLTTIAHMALDRMAETLPMETELRTIKDVTADVLDRIGFGSKSPAQAPASGQTVNVSVNVLRSELEDARSLLNKASGARVEVQIDGLRTPIGIQGGSTAPMGATIEGEAVPVE